MTAKRHSICGSASQMDDCHTNDEVTVVPTGPNSGGAQDVDMVPRDEPEEKEAASGSARKTGEAASVHPDPSVDRVSSTSDSGTLSDHEEPAEETHGDYLDKLAEKLNTTEEVQEQQSLIDTLLKHYESREPELSERGRVPPIIPTGFEGEALSTQLAKAADTVEIDRQIHWQRSITFTQAVRNQHKSWVLQNLAMRGLPGIMSVGKNDVIRALADTGMPPGVVSSIEGINDPSRIPVQTPGRWFFLDLSGHQSFFSDECLWNGTQCKWETAFHGTALHSLPTILLKGLIKGPNSIPDSRGRIQARVYCEGLKRVECAFAYSTHVGVPNNKPNLCFGALLELMVDRQRGDTRRGQWTQSPESVHVVGCWVHCADLNTAYAQPGTLRYH